MDTDFMKMAQQLPDDELVTLYDLLCGLQHKPQLPASDRPEAEKT